MPPKKTPSSKKKQSKNHIPKWAIGCIIAVCAISVLFVLFWILILGGIFWGAGRYSDELRKAGIQYNPQKEAIQFTNTNTGEKVTIGKQDGSSADLPDVPLYPKAKTVFKLTSTKNPSITLTSEDKSALIKEWYIRELPKKGWKIKTSQQFLIDFENKSYTGTVAFIQLDDGTTVTIAFEQK